MNNYKFPRGSEWHKWDLHAHTPLDSDWIPPRPSLSTDAEKKQFAQQHVAAAIRAGLAVVAITDHNFCRSRNELLIPFIQRAASGSGLTILPGFELTVTDCGGTHVLVIFSEDSSLDIIDDIVSQLFDPGAPRFLKNGVSPSTKKIEELDGILRLSKLNYLVVFAHADRENGVLNQQPGSLRAKLWQQPFVRIAQLSKSPSECTVFIGQVVNGISPDYSRNITYVVASDCRCLEQGEVNHERCALGQCYTWIKASPTFEGLRQIIFEPKERVCFQEHKPEEKPAYRIIDQVRFLDSSGKFQPDPIPLNPNLTTIIGGKSTGKSILLSYIARTINREYAQKAINIAKTNVYDFGNLDFEVTWKSGDVDKLSENTGQRHVTFLPQMFIHSLIEDENRSHLSEYLLTFLRQDTSFEARYYELVKKRNEIMMQQATEISNFFSQLSTLRDIENKIEKLGNRSSIEAELQIIAKNSEALRESSGFTEEESETYNGLQLNLTNLNAQYEAIQRIQACFQELGNQIPALIEDTITRLDDRVEEVTTSHELEEAEIKSVKSHMIKLKEAIQVANKEFVKETSRAAQKLSSELKTTIAGLDTAKSALKPFSDKISNQKKLVELQDATNQATLLLKQISGHEKAKLNIEKKYQHSVKKIGEFITERYKIQEKIIELFNDPTYTKIGDDIVVIADLTFDKDKFNNDFLGCFDRRIDISRLGSFFQNNGIAWSQDKHVEIITGIFHKLIESSEAALILRSGQTLQNAVEILLRDYLSHEFTVKQRDEDIFIMSPGKQGLILLEIYLYLSTSTYPILIDQPEDNLDSRTIYSHLVNYIKTRKQHRQIIIVTHNPNLVLGSDAEQIIVANQDGQGQGKNEKYRFEYVSGPIECSFTDSKILSVLGAQGIREHVCQILEGGKEAFRKREEKYCLG
jgi:hypothetical protein